MQVEVLVARPDLEFDPALVIAVEEQDAVSQHAVQEVGRRGVPRHEIDLAPEQIRESNLQVGEAVEVRKRLRRTCAEQDADVDVAVRARLTPRDAAEEIRGVDAVWMRGEEAAQGFDRGLGVHAGMVERSSARTAHPNRGELHARPLIRFESHLACHRRRHPRRWSHLGAVHLDQDHTSSVAHDA